MTQLSAPTMSTTTPVSSVHFLLFSSILPPCRRHMTFEGLVSYLQWGATEIEEKSLGHPESFRGYQVPEQPACLY